MKKQTLTFLAILSIAIGVNAQPNFTSSDMPNIGDKDTVLYMSYSGNMNDIEIETGNSYVWDFSGEFFLQNIYNVETYRVKTDPVSTPYVDATIEHYVNGTSGIGVSLYDYSNDTLFIHRTGAGGTGTAFLPPLPSIIFPIVFNQSSYINTPMFPNGIAAGERITTVLYDGFGPITLPGNRTFNNVFRIKHTEVDSSYLGGTPVTRVNYYWYKQGGQVPLFRIVTVNGVNYSMHVSQASNMSIGLSEYKNNNSTSAYPNPTSGQLTLSIAQDQVQHIELFDIHGKQIKKFAREINIVDITDIENGVYFLKLTTNKTIDTIKILKR